jgi:uncharacterized protein
MAHPNEDRIRQGYAAFASGDIEAVLEFFDDDIVWHTGGNNPISGDYRGKEEVLAHLGRLLQETEGNFKNEVHDILANDEHGVAITNLSAERNGRSMTMRSVHVMHLRDGKVTESWIFPEDQAAADEFWS